MRPYGSKRTLGNCMTKKSGHGGKIHIIERIKNHKFNRKVKIEL
jgi:hypothetical protein